MVFKLNPCILVSLSVFGRLKLDVVVDNRFVWPKVDLSNKNAKVMNSLENLSPLVCINTRLIFV